MSRVAAFIDDLNELQAQHGLEVGWTPSGLAVFNAGEAHPIGHIVGESSDGGGPFNTTLYEDLEWIPEDER